MSRCFDLAQGREVSWATQVSVRHRALDLPQHCSRHGRDRQVAKQKSKCMLKTPVAMAALLLLVGCGRFDEAAEHEGCQKAHPNDQVAANNCFKVATDKWTEEHAWLPRVTHRREPAP